MLTPVKLIFLCTVHISYLGHKSVERLKPYNYTNGFPTPSHMFTVQFQPNTFVPRTLFFTDHRIFKVLCPRPSNQTIYQHKNWWRVSILSLVFTDLSFRRSFLIPFNVSTFFKCVFGPFCIYKPFTINHRRQVPYKMITNGIQMTLPIYHRYHIYLNTNHNSYFRISVKNMCAT